MQEKQVWIGLVEVRPWGDNPLLGAAPGAYVQVLVLADSLESFCAQAAEALVQLRFDAVGFEDVEPLDERAGRVTVQRPIIEMAREVRDTNECRLGTFHVYESDEE